MPRPVPTRRPDSLFDNRYRYDHIYPRGRSGETLRAYDTQNGDRPVVIKRPALQDAPPIRAGQEVSILREKRALEALAGHPVLTELRHIGTFRVGGQAHQYIAVDMAQGQTVEALVLELAGHGERLPELEMLVIFDGLLDLLQAAHDRGIIYNDVDAKHLFWDRDHYRLKVIDWGNCIFLDTDSVPPHVSRASDIFQTGQLIYFVLSGGRRLEMGRADPANDLDEAIALRLKAIINRATQPEANQRYPDVAALRQELAEVRRPLEKNRDMLVERVRARLPTANSQDQLAQLRDLLAEALQLDPGYPAARTLLAETENQLRQLALQADLDAVRIYIESGNTTRATELIQEMGERLGDGEQPLLRFFLDVCEELQGQSQPLISEGLRPALDALLKGDAQGAGRLFMTTVDLRPAGKTQQLLLAERLALRMPGVVLLRPHLARLEQQLRQVTGGQDLARNVQGLLSRLDDPVFPAIQSLRQVFQRLADSLVLLESNLDAVFKHAMHEEIREGPDSPLRALERARKTADDVTELLEVVAQNVYSDPSRAGNALWHAAAIDPANPGFESVNNILNDFHTELDGLRGFVPAADGSSIGAFLSEAQGRLRSYSQDISDGGFQAIVQGVDSAIRNWARAADFVALGGRRPALDACRQAAEAIRHLNQATARWFEDYAGRLEEAPRVEMLSPNPALGKLLGDGWEAWDRGRGGEAQALGERAAAAATTDGEKLAARRLVGLGEVLASWLTNDGPGSPERTDRAEERALALLLPEEEAARRKFGDQMPSMQTYLRAMVKGIVEPMREASAAAIRALFLHYVLRGMLALHQEKYDDVNFWREAAAKTLTNARLHPAFQALDNAMTRRQLVLEAVSALNGIHTVSDLAAARQAVRAPLAAAQLEFADQSVRAVDDALRRWPDGDFRAARQLLDTALERASMAEGAMGKELANYRTWLQDLIDTAEYLAQARRTIEQAALVPADAPDPAVDEAHQKLVDLTRRDLGEAYTAQLRQWRDTYAAMRNIYEEETLSKDEKLRLFDGHFASLFIDRQPSLPIFRHWQNVIRLQPDQVAPLPPALTPAPFGAAPPVPVPPYAQEPSPRPAYSRRETAEIIDVPDEPPEPPATAPRARSDSQTPSPSSIREAARPAPEAPAAPPAPRPSGQRAFSRLLTLGALVTLLMVLGAVFLILRSRQGPPELPVTLGANTRVAAGASLPTATPTIEPTNTLEPTFTPTHTPTRTPSQTPTPAPSATPTPIQAVPTPTPTGVLPPTATEPGTLIPGNVLPGTLVPTNPGIVLPTPVPEAPSGEFDLLQALERLPAEKIVWETAWFRPSDKYWQLGNATSKTEFPPRIRLGPDVLTPLFGVDAARYLKRVEGAFEVTGYDQSKVKIGQVFFVLGLESISGTRTIIEVKVIGENVLQVRSLLSGRQTKLTQVPAVGLKLKASLARNDDKTVSLLVNDQLLDKLAVGYGPEMPVIVLLYTSQGGVVVNVTSLSIQMSKE